MSDLFRNHVTDERIIKADEDLRAILEQSLKSFLDRKVEVKSSSSYAFDYKEVKSLFPGEIIVCTLNCTDGAQGKLRFALKKESGGILGDLLNMGDGKQEFVPDQHIEPLRDMFKEVVAAHASALGQEVGRSLTFDDIKMVIMDLTPNDFSGETWTVSSFDFDVEGSHRIVTMISNEFHESVFPRDAPEDKVDDSEGVLAESPMQSRVQEEIGLVMDIELPIAIELGRTKMLIRDIVRLSPGSVVELNKLSGEPVDIYVNNKRFARGEVVVVDDNFAVRLTELSTPAMRLEVSRN
jgi:flagellar motor switch protein FliN/FliY